MGNIMLDKRKDPTSREPECSPYLQRRLRTVEEAQRDIAERYRDTTRFPIIVEQDKSIWLKLVGKP
jgi:hypothetical protein